MRLLLLEDDALLGDGLAEYLRGEGYAVRWCQSIAEAEAESVGVHEALLVDWQLPDGSGLDWIAQRRRQGDHAAVIVLTARDRVHERVRGLDAGADDYLVKPFAPEELVARLRALARRGPMVGERLVRGDVVLDLAAHAASVAGRAVDLTAREWALLDVLVRRAGRIVPRAELERLVLGHAEPAVSNTLEVHVSSVRRKLGRGAIQTLRGVGYRIGREDEWSSGP